LGLLEAFGAFDYWEGLFEEMENLVNEEGI
jgi:hypothetical protein